MATTLKETLAQLEALDNEKVRAQNSKNGAGDNQFGVRLGAIRKLATKIKTNHALALALWETGNIDAWLLAILLINPKNLSGDELDWMARSVGFAQVAYWLNSYVVKKYPDSAHCDPSTPSTFISISPVWCACVVKQLGPTVLEAPRAPHDI